MSHSGQKLLVPKRLSRPGVGVLHESWDLLSLSLPPKEKRAGSPTEGAEVPCLHLEPGALAYHPPLTIQGTPGAKRPLEEEKGPAALHGSGLSNHGHGTLSKLFS